LGSRHLTDLVSQFHNTVRGSWANLDWQLSISLAGEI
jgi:hypothetical protein